MSCSLRLFRAGLLGLFLLGGLLPSATGGDETMIKVSAVAPGAGQNRHYAGNRPPLLASPLVKLPPGSVRPEGWLRKQLQLMAQGFSGNLAEISKYCKIEGSAWVSRHGQGQNGWEELPYWLKGFVDLGYVLRDERIIAGARRWLEGVLASQREDGYFGPRANWEEKHDIWPNMVMLYALRSFYEATGDGRVLPFMSRYFRWLTTVPLELYLPDSWQKWRGGDNLDSIYWLYNRTGEPWLLDLARVNHERTADWAGTIPTWHGVNICQCFREPAQYYQQSRDPRYFKATERNHDTVWGLYGQVPGGLFGADENARPGYTGPRQGAETCSIVELMHSCQILSRISGDPLWADRCEEAAFNTLPAAMTPDLKGLHYLTAPNQIRLDRANKAPLIENDGDMFSYNPWQFRCCQHNVAMGWPYYCENLWQATPANGLAAMLYAPSSVTAKVGEGSEVTIRESTEYPFDGTVTLAIGTARAVAFPLLLRVPRWSEGARLFVNGKEQKVSAAPASWIVVERNWQNKDTLRLELPMKIAVTVWEKNRNAVSVSYGPLTYALKIGERWQHYGDSEKWPGWEIFPTTPWNFGLIVDLKNPQRSFKVVRPKQPLADQPFTPEAAPVFLKAKGRAVSQWKQEKNGMIGELPEGPVLSREPVKDLILIPMGCARLRVSAFPRSAETGEAKK